jgi:hypothetical protein
MPHTAWLQSLADMVSRFPENQSPSPQLLTDIQLVLDEAIVLAMNHGARLPNFVVERSRLQEIEKRLGQARIAELASQPVTHHAVEGMIPLIARLCADLDAVRSRSANAS